jgi:competence protein ComEC
MAQNSISRLRYMPLAWLSGGFLLGIVLGSIFSVDWRIWTVLSGIGLILGWLEWRLRASLTFLEGWRKISSLPLGIILAVALLGAARYQSVQPNFTDSDLAWYNGLARVRLTGEIIKPPDFRENSTLLQVEVSQLSYPGSTVSRAVHGKLTVILAPGGNWQYGDVIEIEGLPGVPFENEDFSYRDYLARQSVYSVMQFPYMHWTGEQKGNPVLAILYKLRGRAEEVTLRLLPQPEASLLAGILLGQDQHMPDSLKSAFRDTGTAHIYAISGFNIAILAGLFASIAGKIFPKKWATPAAIGAITLYTLLVGAEPPVVRAAIMGGFGLFGRLLGRKQAGENSLTFAAAAMCLFNPMLPWDPSFQLSFMATLGLVLYAEPLQNGFHRLLENRVNPALAAGLEGVVGDYLLVTLAAQITVFPVITAHFQRISLISLIANPLILPPQPLVMTLGGAAVLAGMIFLPLGQGLAYLAYPLMAYTTRLAEWLGNLPGASMAVIGFPIWAVGLFYMILFGITLWKSASVRIQERILAGGLVGLGLLSIFVWRAALAASDGKLHLTLLNVPDGPAVLIRSPGGQAILLNGSSSMDSLASELGRRISPLARRLDMLVITSSGTSIKGLSAIAERFPPGQVIWNEKAADSNAGSALKGILLEKSLTPQFLQEGQIVQLDHGAQIQVLAHNSEGTALLLEYDNFRVLIPGGIRLEQILKQTDMELKGITILILSEEEAESDQSVVWKELMPGTIFYWGAVQPDGESSPNRLAIQDSRWIEISTDGAKMWLEKGN